MTTNPTKTKGRHSTCKTTLGIASKILLLLIPVNSLSSPQIIESRTSVLRSWGRGTKLGWIQERRPTESDVTEVLIGWEQNDNNQVEIDDSSEHEDINPIAKVLLQEKQDVDSLSSSLWPSALAGSILVRSPLLKPVLEKKTVLDLGSGLGLAGLVAATAQPERCILTERDEDAVDLLEETAQLNSQNVAEAIETTCIGGNIEARRLEWRDDHTHTDLSVDVVMGTDIAYYQYLLRPLMDTTQAHLNQHDGLFYVVGAAHRESMWDLYHNIKDGCYNQLTDENEEPWTGMTSMLLYELSVGPWITEDTISDPYDGTSEEIIPIATLMHATKKGIYDSLIGDNDHVATAEDEENQMKSF
mmetsp:Transcript_15701/g.21816  ORF Transcript_15701/g.21816 Transcript_15701/m.21816 type:complete len:358 (-) Transcript_15701:536-1609(-)